MDHPTSSPTCTAATPAVAVTADEPGARARLRGLDALRFGAAVAVLLHHYLSRRSTVWGAPPREVPDR